MCKGEEGAWLGTAHGKGALGSEGQGGPDPGEPGPPAQGAAWDKDLQLCVQRQAS